MSKTEQSDRENFISRFGGIYERSPWVAEECYRVARHIDAQPAALADVFAACVDNASRNQKLILIRNHPDLAGRAAVAGKLTGESTREQGSAGIDQCSPEEFERFQSLNRRYTEKFGFPFVMAVRESNRAEILAAFEHRINNDPDTEFEKAVTEIHEIARLRLEAL